MIDEYADDEEIGEIIELPEDLLQQLWFDAQWPEDKIKFLELEKQLCGLVKWVGL
jgi:hypothetical protein